MEFVLGSDRKLHSSGCIELGSAAVGLGDCSDRKSTARPPPRSAGFKLRKFSLSYARDFLDCVPLLSVTDDNRQRDTRVAG